MYYTKLELSLEQHDSHLDSHHPDYHEHMLHRQFNEQDITELDGLPS